jgi:hypothetical protein
VVLSTVLNYTDENDENKLRNWSVPSCFYSSSLCEVVESAFFPFVLEDFLEFLLEMVINFAAGPAKLPDEVPD